MRFFKANFLKTRFLPQWFIASPFRLILISSAALLATACAKKSAPADAASNATFIALPVVQNDSQVIASDPVSKLPTLKQFEVKVCVQDIGMLQPIISQNFRVQGEGIDSELKTDSNGCLFWKDSVQFNYLGNEQYIQLSRKVVAERPHRGEVDLNLAIDPWKSGSDALVDLRFSHVDSMTAQKIALTRQSAESNLVIQTLNTRFYNQQYSKDGLIVSSQISFSPKFSRTGLGGTQIQETMTDGPIHLDLTLVEKPRVGDSGPMHVLGTQSVDATVVSGSVSANSDFKLDRVPNQYSTLRLYFKATSSLQLKSQESYVEMDQLLSQGGYTAQVLPDTLEHTLTQIKAGSQAPVATARLAPTSPVSAPSSSAAFQFDSVHVSFGGVEKVTPNEKVPSQIALQISACMKGTLDLKPIANFPFSVALCGAENGCQNQFIDRVSDDQGCIQWQDHLSFDYFASERWIPRYLEVRSKSAPYQDQKNQYKAFLDPWQLGSALIQWDSRAGEPPAIASSNAKLDITNFSYNFVGRTFTVDSNINLVIHRKYQFQMTPVIKRPGNLQNGLSYDSIKSGKYRLKALLMTAPDLTKGKPEPLALYSETVTAVNGVILANVEFPVSIAETPLIQARSSVVIELSPIEKETSLSPASVSAAFQALDSSGSYATAGSSSVAQIMEQDGSGATISSLTAHGKSLYFRKSRAGISDQIFKKLTGMTRVKSASTNADFCGVVFANNSLEQDDCKRFPNRYFNTFSFIEVDRVTGAPTELMGDSNSLSVSASFGYSKSHDSSTYQNIHAGADVTAAVTTSVSASTGLKFLGNGVEGSVTGSVSVSGNAGYGIAHSWGDGESHSHQVSLVEVKSLLAETLEFSIPVIGRICTGVSPINPKFKGAYICANQGTPQEITESWYSVTQPRLWNSVLQDSGNMADLGWSRIIRGRGNYHDFVKMIQDRSQTIVFEKDESMINQASAIGSAWGKVSGLVPLLVDGGIPGVVMLLTAP